MSKICVFKSCTLLIKNCAMTSNETKFVYYIGDEKTPYVSKINIPPQVITLGDFKATIKKPNYKFFFRSEDQDFG